MRVQVAFIMYRDCDLGTISSYDAADLPASSLHCIRARMSEYPIVWFISAANGQVYIALRSARYRQELEHTVLSQALLRSMDGLVPITSHMFISL
jgi:hypothetical protein